MRANRATSSRTEIVVPRLNAWLTLTPSNLERRFWLSSVFLQHAKSVDCFTIYLTIVMNSNLMFLTSDDMNECFVVPTKPLFVLFVLQSVAQRVIMAVASQHYFRWRPRYLLLFRGCRFLAVAFLLFHLRRHVRAGCTYHCLPQTSDTSPVHVAPLLAAARGLVTISMAALPLVHGCSNPLPLGPQVAFHLLSTAILIQWQLLPAISLLSSEPCTQQLRLLCSHTNALFSLTQRLLLSLPANTHHMVASCDAHATRVLLLFAVIYFGCALPIYIAYRSERKRKQDFLVELHRASPGEVDLSRVTFVHVPHPLDVLVPAALAVLTWINVVYLHQYISPFPL